MAAALVEIGVEAPTPMPIEWRAVALAWPYRLPKDVERVDAVEYAPGLCLDVYRRRDFEAGSHPALLQVHGGGWRGGNRRQQARPLIRRLTQAGWVCVAIDYPLVPEATFPDQLVAVKRALAWMRSEGHEHGIDPGFIAITGGSAGGHLSALAALTPGRPEYQPGFEGADTTVQAAVPFYGIYDFLNRNATRDEWPVIPTGVMKASKSKQPELFRAASPLDQVNETAPPFLVVHGDTDSVVPPREATQFVEALESVSGRPVGYALLPGANHAFDVFESLRAHHAVAGVTAFLTHVLESGRVDAR
jgi:acetyl esterase/lipase